MSFLIKQLRDNVDNLLAAEKAEAIMDVRILKTALNCTIRKWSDYQKVHFVSEAAKVEADKLGVNLFEQQWKTQYKFDKGRKIFIMEHKYPVNDMILDMKANPDKIEDIMNSADMGWILKTEDQRLQSYNRGDHDAMYEEANIRLIRR